MRKTLVNKLQSVHMPNTFSAYLWILVRKILVDNSRFTNFSLAKFSHVRHIGFSVQQNIVMNWTHMNCCDFWSTDDLPATYMQTLWKFNMHYYYCDQWKDDIPFRMVPTIVQQSLHVRNNAEHRNMNTHKHMWIIRGNLYELNAFS